MTAIPPWPPQSTTRLFVETELSRGSTLTISGGRAHYLIAVMRLKAGDPVKLFDNVSGEWLAIVDHVAKRDVHLTLTAHLRLREPVPDLWLVAAPIKKTRIDMMAEKACELGIARYVPVITHRTITERLNTGRLRAHMIEAAEQCGRTAIPEIADPVKLAALLKNWQAGRTLYFADEQGGDLFCPGRGPAAILIGPEGGFDDEERRAIRAMPEAVAITLGPRILRAETAAIAAVTIWMAHAGDWISPPHSFDPGAELHGE